MNDCYERPTLVTRKVLDPLCCWISTIVLLLLDYTPPRPSEISEKDWSTKSKSFLTSHLWYNPLLKVWKKSWEPFRIYQLTRTAKGSQDFIYTFSINKWDVKNGYAFVLNFFLLISDGLGGVTGFRFLIPIYHFFHTSFC